MLSCFHQMQRSHTLLLSICLLNKLDSFLLESKSVFMNISVYAYNYVCTCTGVCICVWVYVCTLDIDDHLFVNVGITDYGTKLVERDFAVLVLVGEHNCLVNYLLQLGVFQVVAHHHF